MYPEFVPGFLVHGQKRSKAKACDSNLPKGVVTSAELILLNLWLALVVHPCIIALSLVPCVYKWCGEVFKLIRKERSGVGES